mgnify:CR=1 FL=1
MKDSYAVGSIKGSMSNGALGGLIGWHNNKNSNIVQNCYTAMSMNIDGTGQSGHRPGGFIGIMGESDATGTLANNVSYSNGTKVTSLMEHQIKQDIKPEHRYPKILH